MAYAALQWQATNDKNQLVLGPNGQQAVISVEGFGQISTIKLPDPGTSTTNFILQDVKGASQTINGNLTITGSTTVNGNETVKGNLVVDGTITGTGGTDLAGDLVFSNAADRAIRFDATKATAGAKLSILGNASSGGAGGEIAITAGAPTAGNNAGGPLNLKAGAGSGTSAGGDVSITGGAGSLTAGSNGGSVSLTGGDSNSTGQSGSILLNAGPTNVAGGVGGQAALNAGDGNGSGLGGNLTLSAGDAGATAAGAGGKVDITAGKAGPANIGGAVNVTAGAGNTTGVGGALNLTAGAGGATGVGGAVVVLSGAAAGAASGKVTVDVGAGTTNGAIEIGAGTNAPATITIGKSTMTGATKVVGSIAGGVQLNGGGNQKMEVVTASVASPTATVALNSRTGHAVFTGFTTAAAGKQNFTVTNTSHTATTQTILATVCNMGTNDAQMTLTRVNNQTAGTLIFNTINNGADALNGDVHVNFWILD